jgi:hypothetical protein
MEPRALKAIDQARMLYEEADLDFDEIVADHLHDGIVLSSPIWFLMLRAVQLEETGGLAWFVECAIGNMKALANLVSIKLPHIAFCRVKNGVKRMKVYDSDRLLRLARRDVLIP